MKNFSVMLLGIAISGLVGLWLPSRGAAYERTLNGELVVLGASGHRFRIVGYDGSFVAPPGTPLEALDGRPVQVQVASNGKVEQITEVPVPIQPILHGWSVARGQLEMKDEINGTFTLAGDNQIYRAPPSVNIASYAGRMVEVNIDENGRVTTIEPVGPLGSSAPVPANLGCDYGSRTYSAGSAVCQSGMLYRCDGNQWMSLGSSCTAGGPIASSGSPATRSCAIGDATVANGSSVCRGATTFRCDDGAWINVGTACR